jgi:hypothetical protein
VLNDALDQACAGASRFVVVSGEPGIGKISLLAELGRRAERRGCPVFRGRASELETELPFGLAVDSFDAYLESLDARAHERLAADDLGELASVFPSLRSLRASSEEPRTPAERFRAHHAVRELIERLAARQPIALELDDVHWSDGASLELICHLLRRPPQAAVLPVLGASEGLYRASAGNPFYLLQLARSSPTPPCGRRRRGWLARRSSGRDRGDRGRAGRPATPVRAFAQAAAVAGDPFELELAAASAAVREADELTQLDELVARGLVRPSEVPLRFQFRHPLVRSAVYESCSPGARWPRTRWPPAAPRPPRGRTTSSSPRDTATRPPCSCGRRRRWLRSRDASGRAVRAPLPRWSSFRNGTRVRLPRS